MEYTEIINTAKFIVKDYSISFSDALKIVLESEKIEKIDNIYSTLRDLADTLDYEGPIQKEFDTLNLFLEKISKSL